jgi:23S rRNA (uracil1939-C5)-methyltransferase
VLELYAGHGNFTVALAPLAASLCAVEADARAAEACRTNVAERGLTSVRVIAGSTEQLNVTGRFDVLVLDPPRAGAASLAALVARHKPARVVYVSCHMTTLGRDLRAVRELGFRVDRAHVLDMFPQTAHVEAVVRLVRSPASDQA